MKTSLRRRLWILGLLAIAALASTASAHHADPSPEKAPWYLPPGAPQLPSTPN